LEWPANQHEFENNGEKINLLLKQGNLEIQGLQDRVRHSQAIANAVVSQSLLSSRSKTARHNKDNEQNADTEPEESNAIQNKKDNSGKVVIRRVILGQHQTENVAKTRARIAKGSTKQVRKEAAKSVHNGVAFPLIIIKAKNIIVHVHSRSNTRRNQMGLSQFLISRGVLDNGHSVVIKQTKQNKTKQNEKSRKEKKRTGRQLAKNSDDFAKLSTQS